MTATPRLTAGLLSDGRAYVLLTKIADSVASINNAAEGTTVHTFPANQTVRRPEAVIPVAIYGGGAPQVGLVLARWTVVTDPVTVTVTWFNATGGALTPNVAQAVDAIIIGTS